MKNHIVLRLVSVLVALIMAVTLYAARADEYVDAQNMIESQLRSYALQNVQAVEQALASPDPVLVFLEQYWKAGQDKQISLTDLDTFIRTNRLFASTLLRSKVVKTAIVKFRETKKDAIKLEEQKALDYSRAEIMQQAGMFDEAASLYLLLGDYQDAGQRAKECGLVRDGIQYLKAAAFVEEGNHLAAYQAFTAIPGYRDADARGLEAILEFISDKTESAIEAFVKQPVNYASYNQLINGIHADKQIPQGALDAYHSSLFRIGSAALQVNEYDTAIDLFDYLNKYEYPGAAAMLQQAEAIMQSAAAATQPAAAPLESIKAIAGGTYPFYIQRRGTVTGPAVQVYPDSTKWENVVSAGSNLFYAAALHKDGTVSIATNPSFYQGVGQFKVPLPDVSTWKGITHIAVGANHIAGINGQGKILTAGSNTYGQIGFPSSQRALAISAGMYSTLIISENRPQYFGIPLFNQLGINQSISADAIAAGAYHSLVLTPSGSVRASGLNADGQCEVSAWKEIKAIAAGSYHSVGIKKDGTVIAAGLNDKGQLDVGGWTDIISIAAGPAYTIGLKSDHSIVSTAADRLISPYVTSAWISANPADWASLAVAPSGGRYDLDDVKVGSVIEFGHYEQDNDLSNGAEPIQWRVLKQEGDKVMLVSLYGLDCQPYNTKRVAVTWADSTIRSWLNSDFSKTAFNEEESSAILLSDVSNESNSTFKTDGGIETKDKVFLLSINEAATLFENKQDRVTKNTVYSNAQGAKSNSGAGWWWLRSPGGDPNNAAIVFTDGSVYRNGYYVNHDNNAVRPALWLDLSSW